MKQEDKELLLKDLCARLPYGVKMTDGVDTYRLTSPFLYKYIEMELKPYLRPMSSMTDDEQKELEKIIDGIIGYNAKNYFHSEDEYNWNTLYNAYDWLNAHHFDYRGLIPMRLALEAKEGMYES